MFDQLIHFFTTPDKAWSLVSLPFAVAFVLFFGLYIAIRHSFKTLMLAYVVAFSLFFAYKANGVLMLLLPATVLLSYYLTRKMDEWEGPRRKGLMWLTVAVELLPLLYYNPLQLLAAGHHPACGNIVLHVPGHQLHRRRIQGEVHHRDEPA